MVNVYQSFSPQFTPRNSPVADFSAAMTGGVVFYRGIDRVWIGDGTGTYEGSSDEGILYAQTVDDVVVAVGPVSSYYYAASKGFQGSFEDWVEFMLNISNTTAQIQQYAQATEQSATRAEAAAVSVSPITDAQIDALFV